MLVKRLDGVDNRQGWVGRADIPILLRGAVSRWGGPKGPGRLVEGGAWCKSVPRGVGGRGQGLGRDRAGQGGWEGSGDRGRSRVTTTKDSDKSSSTYTSGQRLRVKG